MLYVLSHVGLFAAPRTVAHQTLLPMGSPGKNPGVWCHFLIQRTFPALDQTLLDQSIFRFGSWILYH